jgi:hypothetical protein
MFFCGREGIQTPSLLIRSQTLYSVELRNHFTFKGFAKVKKNVNIESLYRIIL